jgi:hypothetical protein
MSKLKKNQQLHRSPHVLKEKAPSVAWTSFCSQWHASFHRVVIQHIEVIYDPQMYRTYLLPEKYSICIVPLIFHRRKTLGK